MLDSLVKQFQDIPAIFIPPASFTNRQTG